MNPTSLDPSHGLDPAVPVEDRERLASLDIIRALAYFAVLLIHASIFARAGQAHGALDSGGRVDGLVALLTDVFIRGKGISCFSMLFGVGFFIQFERAAAKGHAVLPFALRRLGALFILGALHYRFVWTGDVLLLYATLGFALIPFLGTRPRTILAAALGVFLLLSLVPNLAHALGLDPRWSIEAWHRPEIQALGNRPLQGLFGMEVPARIGRTIARMLQEAGSILPLFLLGAALWRSGMIAEPGAHAARLRRLFNVSFPLGLALSFLVHDPLGWVPAAWRHLGYGTAWGLVAELGTFTLALGYVAGLLRLLAHPGWLGRFSLLAPLGRMALTNYLTHTLLLAAFLKLWAELGFTVGSTVSLGTALLIYGVQLAWSRAWMARFRFGPLEWVWRCITYKCLEPLR